MTTSPPGRPKPDTWSAVFVHRSGLAVVYTRSNKFTAWLCADGFVEVLRIGGWRHHIMCMHETDRRGVWVGSAKQYFSKANAQLRKDLS